MSTESDPTPGAAAPSPADAQLERALDAALARALLAPGPSSAFRERLRAAIARGETVDVGAQRARLERELSAQMAELKSGYVRLQRRTLAAILGGAFAAGAAAMIALPWLQSHFGAGSIIAVPLVGVVVGLAIGASQVVNRIAPARY
jgi:hypothetical protein